MTERFLSKLYDRSALVADLLESVGARITTWGYHKDTLTGKATHDTRHITVADYVSFVELPELLAPNVYKVETEETNVPYVGKMITQTTTYYKDGSYDVDFFEIVPNADSYKTESIFEKINEFDKELRKLFVRETRDLSIYGKLDVTFNAGTHDATTETIATAHMASDGDHRSYFDIIFNKNPDGDRDIVCIRKTYKVFEDICWYCSNVEYVEQYYSMIDKGNVFRVFHNEYSAICKDGV